MKTSQGIEEAVAAAASAVAIWHLRQQSTTQLMLAAAAVDRSMTPGLPGGAIPTPTLSTFRMVLNASAVMPSAPLENSQANF